MTKPQRQTTTAQTVPAPIAGLMVNDIGYASATEAEAETGALFCDNFIARDLGLTVRPGSRELVSGLPGDDDLPGEVRTIIEYLSPVSPAQNRVFAATNAGIFDITAGGEGPWVPVLDWPTGGADAGYCSYINHTNPAGAHFLLVCDEANGYYQYVASTDTWEAGTITGGTPLAGDLVQITEWQNRIILVERGTATLWYLPLGAIDGNPVEIELGSRFLRGGDLKQVTVWTVDDGAGLNDRLLCLSGAGDLLAFSGSDPDQASQFLMDGRWYVGTPPAGRRCMSEWAGEVYITTSYGMVLASTVIAGEQGLLSNQISRNITRYFRANMAKYQNAYGWSTEFFGSLGLGVFTVPNPPPSSDMPRQFVLNLTTRAWTRFVGLDMLCCQKAVGKFLFGDHTGSVWSLEGTVDNVTLAEGIGEPIQFALLTHYRDFGSKGTWKGVTFLRPYFLGASIPSFRVQAKYDYDITYGGSTPPLNTSGLPLWDEAVWDANTWGGGLEPDVNIRGASGMGRNIAIEMHGEAVNSLSLLRWDVMLHTGGLL